MQDIEARIQHFMGSDDTELSFEPMNSYKRRLVHQASKPFNLDTDSRGDEPERYVCLIKNENSKAPQGMKKAHLWDFGTQGYSVNPGESGLHLALKADGSVEIYREADRHQVVDQKVVTGRQIRIRGGKIVEPGDPAW